MGSAKSVSLPPPPEEITRRLTKEQWVQYIMPVYYTKQSLSSEEKEKLLSTWKLIRMNKAPGYHRLKREQPEVTPCNSSMEYFANRLTVRLIDVHPTARSMFTKTTLKQGTMVMNMISFLLSVMDDEEKFRKHLEMLAASHCRLGVRAAEFGIFGEVIFWTLRINLDPEEYTVLAHTAWVKFYSRMLEVIVPVVLRYEIEHSHSSLNSNIDFKQSMPIIELMKLVTEGLQDRDSVVVL